VVDGLFQQQVGSSQRGGVSELGALYIEKVMRQFVQFLHFCSQSSDSDSSGHGAPLRQQPS